MHICLSPFAFCVSYLKLFPEETLENDGYILYSLFDKYFLIYSDHCPCTLLYTLNTLLAEQNFSLFNPSTSLTSQDYRFEVDSIFTLRVDRQRMTQSEAEGLILPEAK